MTPDGRDPFAEGDPELERERRRAERDARRREREASRRERRGALGDRVRDVLSGKPRGPSKTPARDQPAPPSPRRGAVPPSPPGRPDVHRQRRLWAAAAIVALVVVVGLVAIAIGRSGGGGTTATTTEAPPAKTVTIPEGFDRRGIAAAAKREGVRGDYMKASESAKGFNPARYGASDPPSLEGFLFPATYDLPRRPTAEDLVVRQLAAFKQYISQVDMRYARSKNLTTFDVLIIASMIEREVQVPKERRLVAAVIYNRLRNGMPLQIDATIRFAEGNYTKALTESDLQLDSPYNTYVNSGLPPGPIGNPGLASIEAAADPAKVSYLYYVVKPNTCGEHTFANTSAQFERAKAAYDQAREAAGGEAPTPADCPGV